MTNHESSSMGEAPQVQTHAEYLALLNSPVFRELQHRHFTERIGVKIFDTYNKAIVTFASQESHSGDIDAVHEAAIRASTLDSPLLVLSDKDTDTGEADGILLGKVDPRTGEMVSESLMAVASFTDSVPSKLHYSFTDEQVNILLRQGIEQGALGLSPITAYSMSLLSPNTEQ
jgi:hypothetical protein